MSIINIPLSDEEFKTYFPPYCHDSGYFFYPPFSQDLLYVPLDRKSFKILTWFFCKPVDMTEAFSKKLEELRQSLLSSDRPISENPRMRLFEDWTNDHSILEKICQLSRPLLQLTPSTPIPHPYQNTTENSLITLAMRYPKLAEMYAVITNSLQNRDFSLHNAPGTFSPPLTHLYALMILNLGISQETGSRISDIVAKYVCNLSYVSKEGIAYHDFFNRKKEFFVKRRESPFEKVVPKRNFLVALESKLVKANLDTDLIQHIYSFIKEEGLRPKDTLFDTEIEDRNALTVELSPYIFGQRLLSKTTCMEILFSVYRTKPALFSLCFFVLQELFPRPPILDLSDALNLEEYQEALGEESIPQPISPEEHIDFIKKLLTLFFDYKEERFRYNPCILYLQIIQRDLKTKYPNENVDLSSLLYSSLSRKYFLDSYQIHRQNYFLYEFFPLNIDPLFASTGSYAAFQRTKKGWENLESTSLDPKLAQGIADALVFSLTKQLGLQERIDLPTSDTSYIPFRLAFDTKITPARPIPNPTSSTESDHFITIANALENLQQGSYVGLSSSSERIRILFQRGCYIVPFLQCLDTALRKWRIEALIYYPSIFGPKKSSLEL